MDIMHHFSPHVYWCNYLYHNRGDVLAPTIPELAQKMDALGDRMAWRILYVGGYKRPLPRIPQTYFGEM